MVNILFIGDVVGFSGLDYLNENLNYIEKKYNTQFIIVNGENICNGKGITEREANVLLELGTSVITTGNHIWDNWYAQRLLKSSDNVLRPYNYPSGNAGLGYKITTIPYTDIKIAVMQLQGRTFMYPIDCPFRAANKVINSINNNEVKIIVVDFHAEATSEKVSMGWYLDGRVSAVIGTHTHVQTADAQIFPQGTAYISDVGMTGPYNSVLGLKTDVSLNRIIYQTAHKYEPASENNKIAGVVIKVDENTGKSLSIESFIYPEFDRGV
ncbi:MAG: TIGR00282 family metallophosphoesterase [Bacteroidetes bacterium]|nr:TIGR00282 family metallophosphoesterase [Bacteroidota bacterium]